MTARDEAPLTPDVERTDDGRYRPLVSGNAVPGDPACASEAEAKSYAKHWAAYWSGLRRVLRKRRPE